MYTVATTISTICGNYFTQQVDYFFVKNRQKSKIVKNNKIIKLVPHFDLKIFRILTLNIN